MLAHLQLAVQTTVEKALDLIREVLVSRDDLQRRLRTAERISHEALSSVEIWTLSAVMRSWSWS